MSLVDTFCWLAENFQNEKYFYTKSVNEKKQFGVISVTKI